MTVKEVLLKAAEIIEERGWCQGSYNKETGEVCAKGGLRKAVGWPHQDGEGYYGALDALYTLIGAGTILSWNDTPGRTKSDVITALRQAAEACQ